MQIIPSLRERRHPIRSHDHEEDERHPKKCGVSRYHPVERVRLERLGREFDHREVQVRVVGRRRQKSGFGRPEGSRSADNADSRSLQPTTMSGTSGFSQLPLLTGRSHTHSNGRAGLAMGRRRQRQARRHPRCRH